MSKITPRRLTATFLILLLAVLFVGITAAVENPGFLEATVSDIAAANHTYRIWYTLNCNDGQDCECDSIADVDSDDDDVPDTDSANDCVAVVDDDADQILDTAVDTDGDGIPDVVDVDWLGGGDGSGLVESVSRNVINILDRYVNDWAMKDPFWDSEENRNIYIYNIAYLGFASGDGSGEELDTAWMLTQAPEPRGTTLHELWHNTQFAYGAGGGLWLIEGQARMLQDKVFDDLDNRVGSRYHNSVNTYLGDTNYVTQEDRDDDGDSEFDQARGLLGADYDASLWWTYLAGIAGTGFVGTAGAGMDFLIAVLEEADENGRTGVDGVDQVLQDRLGMGFDDAFWLFTVANYAKEFDLSELDSSYLNGLAAETFLKYSDEKRDNPDMLIYGPVERKTYSSGELLGDVSGSVAAFDSEVSDAEAMPAYGVNYYEGTLPAETGCLLAYWRVIGDPDARLLHSWLLLQEDSNGDGLEEVVVVSRSEGPDFARAMWNSELAVTGGVTSPYTRMVGVVAAGSEPYGYEWEMGCTVPAIDIIYPRTANPVYVGAPDEPGRFLVWLEISGETGSSNFVEGLQWDRDFTVLVGDEEATILNGGYVQNQYWLSVQAPEQPGAAIGDLFGLEVQLGPPALNISDAEDEAVIYDTVLTDQVLVIDRSGSMGDNNKLVSAQTAARLFSDVVSQFERLGVVGFNADADEVFELTQIPDQNDSAGVRGDAQDAIDTLDAAGATSIGDGLDLGQDMLNADGDPDNEWVMVLLSDGIENEPQFWANVRAGIIAAGTEVHVIALGQDADEDKLRSIAADTCGEVWVDRCYQYIEESGVLALRTAEDAESLPNALADLYRRIKEDVDGQQRLWQADGLLDGEQTIAIEVAEEGIRNAYFSINWADVANPLDVSLSGPASLTTLTDDQNHVVFYADELPAGTYSLELSSVNGASDWIGSLSGRIIYGTELHVFVDNLPHERWPGLPVRLQANLTDHLGAVAEATITAVVTHPDGDQQMIQLVDDGGIYDDVAHDGVYGYTYDRINRPFSFDPAQGHTWVFDIQATGTNNEGEIFARYERLAYTPSLRFDPAIFDGDGDGMLDNWERRFAATDYQVADGEVDDDGDGLTNREEFELGLNPDDPDTDRGGEVDGSEVDKGQDPLLTADDTIPALTDFWVENQPEAVVLHFDPRPEYQGMRVYRRVAPAAVFNLLGTLDPSSGAIVDSGLVNDQDYFYYLQPVGASNALGRPTISLYAEPAADPIAPLGILTINHDNKSTSQLNVTLRIQPDRVSEEGLDIVAMQLSNSPDLSQTAWQPFVEQLPWVLQPDPATGAAFVYARFRDAAGNVSRSTWGDGIVYKPVVAIPLPASFDLAWAIFDFDDDAFDDITAFVAELSAPDLTLGLASPLAWMSNAEDGALRFLYGGRSFSLTAEDARGDPITQFREPYTMWLMYEDWQWRSGGLADEASLNLYRKTAAGWLPVLPCDGCQHDTTRNVFVVQSALTGEFALLGELDIHRALHLPVIVR